MKFTMRRESGNDLCAKCAHGTTVRSAFGHELKWCTRGMSNVFVRFPVAECSDFELKGRMTEYDAKQIGWVLEINRESREIIGFRPPKKEE